MHDALSMICWPGKKMGKPYKLENGRLVEMTHDFSKESKPTEYTNSVKKHYTADGVEIVRDGVYLYDDKKYVCVGFSPNNRFSPIILHCRIEETEEHSAWEKVTLAGSTRIHSIPKPIETWVNCYRHNDGTLTMSESFTKENAIATANASGLGTRKLRWNPELKKIIDVTEET